MCSMISGQCDKLRELAIRANELHEYEMERELDQAADLILELRDDLQQANDENAKLKTLLSSALIMARFDGRQYLDKYLREEDGTTLFRELKSVGIEADS